ncbi:hypothetical protein KAM643c_37070 [Aeromonas caviae]|nr:hypothetical protein KAM643c_37070 [Aeromonas caviae]
MKKWFIPLLALWLYGCNAGPGEETIQSQVTARLQAGTDADLFDIRDFAVLGKEERMEGVYLVKVSYQLDWISCRCCTTRISSMTGSAPSSRRWG